MPVKSTAFDAREFRKVTNDLYASPAVGEGDLAIALARKNLEDLEKKSAEKKVALYKIEVQFGRDHHIHAGTAYGMLTLWESGTKLHGGGDALLYVCPGKHLKVNDCEQVIPDSLTGRAVTVCPRCMRAWGRTKLIGQTFYRLPIQKWAEVVHYWFIRLNMNADLRVKYFYQDIRVASDKEQTKELRGDVLENARSESQRIARTYPLENIIRDANAGADIYNRILAFLRM